MDNLNTVLRLSGGRFVDELASALQRIANEVLASGNKGSVAVTISVTKPTNTLDPSIIFSTSIKANLPKSPDISTMLFIDEDGLHAHDPRQAALPEFREVTAIPAVERESDEAVEEREVVND